MKPNDIQIMKEVVNSIKEHNIEYWIDSGTLLGLYRDSKLIENDRDIDISIIDNKSELSELIKSLKRMDLGKFFVKKYNDRIHKIKIKRKFGQRKIDISVFRKHENDLLMPVIRLEKISENLKRFNFFLVSRLIFAKSYIILLRWLNFEIDFNSVILKSLMREKELWCYPSDIVLPSRKSNKSGFYYPKNTENFLVFRYGDWKTPVRKWKSENSDKGFILDERYSKLL